MDSAATQNRFLHVLIFTLLSFATGVLLGQQNWRIHDLKRSLPPIVTPGSPGTQTKTGSAPSDAIVLFDGRDLSAWQKQNGEQAVWKVENDYMEVTKGGGAIRTKQGFGDCQLHIEWASPKLAKKGQGGGNSGVFLMEKYEIQILM